MAVSARLGNPTDPLPEEIMIAFLFPQSTRVDWLVAGTSRRQKEFAQILQLVMWTRTILFAVGVIRLTSPYTPAISQMDTFKDKKFIESGCIPAEGMVSQKKELPCSKK